MNWIIPAIIAKISSRADKTWSITINTNELTPKTVSEISANLNSFGYLAFKEDEFKTQEISLIDSYRSDYEDDSISHSKRQRNILYRLWEHNPEGYHDFEKYYDYHENKINNFLKSKLP